MECYAVLRLLGVFHDILHGEIRKACVSRLIYMALRSSGRHLALRPRCPGFESLLYWIDVESFRKFLTKYSSPHACIKQVFSCAGMMSHLYCLLIC